MKTTPTTGGDATPTTAPASTAETLPVVPFRYTCDPGAEFQASTSGEWVRARAAQAIIDQLRAELAAVQANRDAWVAQCDEAREEAADNKRAWDSAMMQALSNGAACHRAKRERDEARAELAALKAVAPAAGGVVGWQPIETAPKGSGEDGPGNTTHPDYIEPPRVLLMTAEGPMVGFYDWYYHPGYGAGGDSGESPWRAVGSYEQCYAPTHWMPLPPAPQAAQKEGE
jgi:hypothetical protein